LVLDNGDASTSRLRYTEAELDLLNGECRAIADHSNFLGVFAETAADIIAGRALFIDGERTGKAALPIRTLAAGQRQLSFWDDGCAGRATSTVLRGSTGDVAFVNDTAFGSLTLSTAISSDVGDLEIVWLDAAGAVLDSLPIALAAGSTRGFVACTANGAVGDVGARDTNGVIGRCTLTAGAVGNTVAGVTCVGEGRGVDTLE
jgi:hypothetical protein